MNTASAIIGVVLALLALASAQTQYYGQAPAYYGQAPPPYYSCDTYEDCQNQGGSKLCGVNKFGFMSNYDNQCFMDRFNCRFGSSYQKKKDGGCWDW